MTAITIISEIIRDNRVASVTCGLRQRRLVIFCDSLRLIWFVSVDFTYVMDER